MPHLVAAYPALPARAVRPATEEMLTRSPPPSLSWSRNTSVAVIEPSRLVSTIAAVLALLAVKRAEEHDPGVVDQGVCAAELVLHALSGGDERVADGDVGLDGDGAFAQLVGQG